MGTVIKAAFASRPRAGAWMFDIYFIDGSKKHIAKAGRHQADAYLQLVEDLAASPEVKRIDCIPLLPEACRVEAADAAEPPRLAVIGGAA